MLNKVSRGVLPTQVEEMHMKLQGLGMLDDNVLTRVMAPLAILMLRDCAVGSGSFVGVLGGLSLQCDEDLKASRFISMLVQTQMCTVEPKCSADGLLRS